MAAETKTVAAAWADVMADVRELEKGDRNAQQGFSFRGVDAVMNAVGPILRKHRVAVIPSHVDTSMRDVTTNSNKVMREATVRVAYTIVGPDGSTMAGAAAGEAADSGDKATPKAMSVAFRTFLLQALCLPTHETDPDAETYDRGTVETPREQALRGIADAQDQATLHQIKVWAEGQGIDVSAELAARASEVAA